MADDAIARLRAMCGGPRDGALLRVSLGNALLAQADVAGGIEELHAALKFDPNYSAAWRLLGKTLAASGDAAAAIEAYRRGIAAAAERGDKQAEKEMGVFLRRLERSR